MSTVEYASVRKEYADGTLGLDDLNLLVEQGEFLVLLGPSGCGKSTALRLLAGLEDPTSGDILIGGARVNDLPPGDRGLGMVFQSYALYPHMSVADNLAFGLRRNQAKTGISDQEIEERIDAAVAMLDLGAQIDRKPRELSGGQQQRVAIGRALVRRPRVLLMDEPLSNLDATLRNRMRLEIRRLHEQHAITTIYVTHDQVEAMTLADRIAVLKNGRLQQHATPLEAYDRPANRFVASFLGTPPMNLIEGEAKGALFTAEGFSFPLPPHLGGQDGQACFGIRPENIVLLDASAAPDALKAKVMGRENLGAEIILHLRVGGQEIQAVSRPDAIQQRDQGELAVSLDHPSAILLKE